MTSGSRNSLLAESLESHVRSALGRYLLPEPADIRLLSFSENAVFRVTFDDHPSVVIRLHSLDYHDLRAINSELDWVEALARQSDVITPRVYRSRLGERVVVTAASPGRPRNAVVFSDLPGQEPDTENLVVDFGLLGHTTAQLHQHAMTWQAPPTFSRLRWNIGGTLGPAAHWGRWQDGPGLDHEIRSILAPASKLVEARLRDFGQSPERFGLIHADLRLANILMDGQTVQVIDFDDCGLSWYMYDLASALTFIEDDPQVDSLIANWLEGYRRVLPLGQEHEDEIPTMMMLRRLVILAWLGSRPDTELVIAEGDRYARVTGELAEKYLATTTSQV